VADSNRLLEGEDPDTRDPDEVKHWLGVYTELLTLKEQLVTRTAEQKLEVSPAAREELARTDQPLLEEELQRFRSRLDFWRRKEKDLSAR
jgi:hypothetical protein